MKMDYNNGEILIDPSGYIPAKKRIENLIRAGEQLVEARKEFYDYGSDQEDDGYWIDPLRHPSIDMADVSRLQSQALANLRERARSQPSDASESSKIKTEPKDAHSEKAPKPEPKEEKDG